MKNDFEIIGEELHHSVTDGGVVEFAKRVLGEHRQAVRGEGVWNRHATSKLSTQEILERGVDVINDLLIIIRRLTKNSYCSECGNSGSIMERMGGCRDDNESVVCPECHGRFKV